MRMRAPCATGSATGKRIVRSKASSFRCHRRLLNSVPWQAYSTHRISLYIFAYDNIIIAIYSYTKCLAVLTSAH